MGLLDALELVDALTSRTHIDVDAAIGAYEFPMLIRMGAAARTTAAQGPGSNRTRTAHHGAVSMTPYLINSPT
ncbi:hypothetical protein KQY30_33440 [Streptomyces sp. GMY02]|uniref:hypothetical protein n=1 Tax=Streptomyces sp. GMY02 TaxID=1333528 RepID=UPI001C2C8118|nr:hypothetical protein [Streptomyces sp. GMY02]QXE38410.1 hypothetical protein KQY30_33440 [Streptomyces sp. GMY02]